MDNSNYKLVPIVSHQEESYFKEYCGSIVTIVRPAQDEVIGYEHWFKIHGEWVRK